MTTARDKNVLSSAELTLARVLIASYFLAVAVGLTDGVTLAPLFSPIFGDGIASFFSHLILFIMGVLVLTGMFLRQVALTAAGLLIAAHFMTFAVTGTVESQSIWRDIALIGALVLTYGQREGFFTRRPVPLTSTSERRAKSGEPEVFAVGRGKKPKIYKSLEKLWRNHSMY
ncbi:MAG: hypothetical protein ABI459_09415 [Deltaproteobacteria bacterium]